MERKRESRSEGWRFDGGEEVERQIPAGAQTAPSNNT